MFISDNRIKELLELQEQADTEEMSTFDIMRIIMEHYRKGIEYLTLLTEVNVVRRVTRRLVASNLSAYHCYFQRERGSRHKKLTQGFDKNKRNTSSSRQQQIEQNCFRERAAGKKTARRFALLKP